MTKSARLSWFLVPLLAGCTVIGGRLGAQKDAETSRIRPIPISRAAEIPSGSLTYATPIHGDRVKGVFRGVSDSAGLRLLRLDTGDGPQAFPLDSLSELDVQGHGHRYLKRGLAIGAAIDIAVIGAFSLIVYEIVTNIQSDY